MTELRGKRKSAEQKKAKELKNLISNANKKLDILENDLHDAISSEKVVWLRPKTGAGGKGSLVVSDSKFGWMWVEYWKDRGFS